MSDRDPNLFTPLRLRATTIRNRIWITPMCQYSVERRDGVPGTWHLVHLGAFARGGAGLVMTEATAVTAAGRISPQDTGIWTQAQARAWAPIAAFIAECGAVPGIQLAHAGMKASTHRPWDPQQGYITPAEGGWPVVACSAPPERQPDEVRVLRRAGIQQVIRQFAAAARRAVEAGFRVIELHAAHGYLIHEFLSPLTNRRSDEYGGSLESRARLLCEILAAVRAEVGEEIPILVRLSAVDHEPEGLDLDDSVEIARLAARAGADLIDVSSGGLQTTRISVHPGYQVPYAERIRREAAVPVSAVGLITTPELAAQIVADGAADAVMIGRAALLDPHFAAHAAAQTGAELPGWPDQYARARWRS